jgi:hypothetical protein
MPGEEEVITEVLIEPLEMIVSHVGQAIAAAQRAMDENSIAIETELADLRESLGYDLHATWYHFPETTAELKMSISICREERMNSQGKVIGWKAPRLQAAPVNASYTNLFGYDAAGTSTIKTKIVSVPPAGTI